MLQSTSSAIPGKATHAACSGCSLCLLVCPVWRRTRDLRLTPHGRAKALQHGATIEDIAASVEACTLCGACEPVCPENIGLVDMLMQQRRALPPTSISRNVSAHMQTERPRALATHAATATTLLADPTLLHWPALLGHVAKLLGGTRKVAIESDNGADISLALEIGAVIAPHRLKRFLSPLRLRNTVVVADGLLLRSLRVWLPETHFISLGVALNSLAHVRRQLRADDFYVIEPRAYHADHGSLVTHYDDLRAQTGCTMNLDLQRIAIPARDLNLQQRIGREHPDLVEPIRWLVKGRRASRIVVENADDMFACAQVCNIPVVHLAELVEPDLPVRKEAQNAVG
jgi:ferredoxin